MALVLPAVSTEDVFVPVLNPTSAGLLLDPTTSACWLAFMDATVDADPGPTDWHAAEWQACLSSPYAVTLLVGPNGYTLPAGRYSAWVRIDIGGAPGVQRPVGQIFVT
jgi:hypothetical protein